MKTTRKLCTLTNRRNLNKEFFANGSRETHVPAHDWSNEKEKCNDLSDDGTLSTFWHSHTIFVLILSCLVLLYMSVFDNEYHDTAFNVKRGICACILTFLLVGVIHMPDGPFRRPHPAFWRFILCISIVYELLLIFLLFQNVDDSRKLLKVFDSSLGVPLPEKDYGGTCIIYDFDNPSDPFHNVMDKMDGFVVVHFFGWWMKTLILRDFWLCTVLSLMFELLEYTLEHQLPNFSECWWDHWIMDFAICNFFGILLGMKTLEHLRMKPYHWRGMWKIPGYRQKFKRVLLQFTPYSWMDFDWRPMSGIKRFLAMIMVIAIFLLAELNCFYLKFVLWVSPPHWLNLTRLVFFLFVGSVAMRETFQYLDDPNCKRLGRQSWIVLAIIFTEFFIVIRFDWNTVTKPLPTYVVCGWLVGIVCLVMWTFWHFVVKSWLVKMNMHQKREWGSDADDDEEDPDDYGNNTSTTMSKAAINDVTTGDCDHSLVKR